MAEELRKTGISVVGDLPWGAHFCYFYETKQDLLDILIPYFKTGLENKEFCLWVISNSELLTVEEAKSELRNALPDLDRYVAERSIEVVGHEEWFLSGKTFDPHTVANRFRKKLNEALARGYAGMRVNGSPAWLHDAGPKELRKFEAELDKLFPNERTIASCTYPLATIGADEIFDVVRTHQFAIARRQGEWEVLETPELIQAKQEIKRLNEELEQRVIERTRELATANEELRKEITGRKQAEEALAERLRFETLVTELSAAFANLSPNEVDREIDKWLQTLSEFLGVDRASFFQFGEDWTTLYRSHSYTVAGIEPLPSPPIGMKEQFPWITDQLRRGVTVKWSRIPDDMPEEAANEKEYAAKVGAKSGLNIPVLVGGSVLGAISFTSIGTYHDWPEAMVARLRLVGEIFAAAVERKRAEVESKQAEEKLRQSERQLAEAQRLAHIGSWDWDLRTNAVTWSDELYQIFGLQPGTINVAEEVDRFIHPDDLDLGWDTVKRAVASKEPYDYYHRILRPDGTERIARNANGEHIGKALRSGAAGYLVMNASPQELATAITTVASGKSYISNLGLTHLADFMRGDGAQENLLERLTKRQREVLKLVVQGKSTKQIALALNISVKTVESHRMQIMERLDIHDIAGLVRYAIRVGLLEIDDRTTSASN